MLSGKDGTCSLLSTPLLLLYFNFTPSALISFSQIAVHDLYNIDDEKTIESNLIHKKGACSIISKKKVSILNENVSEAADYMHHSGTNEQVNSTPQENM